MVRNQKEVLVGSLVLSALVLLTFVGSAAAQPGADNPGALSQFVVGRCGSQQMSVFNPGSREMFALVIYYEYDGDYDFCDGVVINPHGSEDDEFGDCRSNASDDSSLFELVAVPTQGSIAGRFDLAGRQRLGVTNHIGPVQGTPLPASMFELPTGGDLTDLTSCACTELDDWSLDSDLLEEVGITCP